MSNLEMGLNNNMAFLESILSKENRSKRDLLNIYGDLKVLEYRAFSEKESDLF
ncbi:TPA: hypothetical protein I9085_002416, partial [Clostridium perfringens]|nr:hypothetical protein [Clostridium perfringens]